jgi:uncharacterized phage protein (TIGR01671 family)
MKEILFRAWDEENKKMVYDNWDIPYFQHKVISHFNHNKCMQYTNFKDINKKKIFEDDILFGREEGDGETTAWTNVYYLVFFNEKEGRWQVREKDQKEDSVWCNDLSDVVDEYEIIGNIYENPDLFKNK